MKSLTFILAITLGTSAVAQTRTIAPPSAAGKPAATAPAPAAAQPAPAPGKSATASADAKHSPFNKRRAGKPRPAAARPDTKAEPKPDGKPGEAAPASGGKLVINKKGERDPFVSPIIERTRTAAACTSGGRQCLMVGEIALHGVVHSSGSYIAVVVNGNRTYFLRENDPLADGTVEKITPDSITMRQRSYDAVGRPVTREVIRKLGAPAV